jgi:hypothetical protein
VYQLLTQHLPRFDHKRKALKPSFLDARLYATNHVIISWLFVIFGALKQSRSISRYYKGLCPLRFVHSSAPYSHPPVGSAS